MNERQKMVLLAGFGVFSGMLVYCPWEVGVENPFNRVRHYDPPILAELDIQSKCIYDWSWKSLHHQLSGEMYRARDNVRLFVQIIIWAYLVMLAFLIMKSRAELPNVVENTSFPDQFP